MKTEVPKISMFPIGDENTGFAQYFTGRSWLAPIATSKLLHVPVYNVTFEPGCRNNWHSHTGGQLLIAVGGTGYYQERGEKARRLLPGDVVEIAPDVEHWHGAAPDSWFAHLAIECNPQSNRNAWLEPVSDADYRKATETETPTQEETAPRKMSSEILSDLSANDPEFAQFFSRFASEEVPHATALDARTRIMAILAALIGSGSIETYWTMLPDALHAGVTAIEIKEIVYQAVAYCGFGRIYPFIDITNEQLTACDIHLPLDPQASTTPDNRLERGAQKQIDIFGEGMKDFYKSGPQETVHINRWLADNCFGDYYTRGGLNDRQREMVTFCYLAAQGGCDAQLTAHAKGNMKVGNDRLFLIDVVSQCLPYIGYPRTLNAIRCINESTKE